MRITLLLATLLAACSPFVEAATIDVYTALPNGSSVLPAVGATNVGGNLTTGFIFDEVQVDPQFAGVAPDAYAVGMTNTSANSVTVRAFFGIWAADGPSGGPGTLLQAANTVPVTFAAQHDAFLYIYDGFPLPGNSFWLGWALNAIGLSTSAADLNSLTFDLSSGPTVGTTLSPALFGSVPADFGLVPQPVSGSVGSDLAVRILTSTPEPSSLLLLLSALAVAVTGASLGKAQKV